MYKNRLTYAASYEAKSKIAYGILFLAIQALSDETKGSIIIER